MSSPLFWIVLASELAAAWIIWRLWRSNDHRSFKVSLSILALIPVLGPVAAFWIGNFPDRQPSAWRSLMGHLYQQPETPFSGPLAAPPTRPKWVAQSWYALLGLAILLVLILYVVVVRDIVK